MSGVYRIVCVANGMQYYGETSDFSRRFHEHDNSLKSGRHRNHYLQDDYNIYGEDNFVFEIIQEVDDRQEMDRLEASAIADATAAGLCYNIFTGGRFGKVQDDAFKEKLSSKNKGRKLGEEFSKKASESAKKQWENDEYRRLMVESAKRQWQDPDYRELMRHAHVGRKYSDEQIEAMRQRNIGKKLSDETKLKMSLKRRGEDNGRAKLTADQVIEIRARAAAGERYDELASEFGISPGNCHAIISRKTWKYV